MNVNKDLSQYTAFVSHQTLLDMSRPIVRSSTERIVDNIAPQSKTSNNWFYGLLTTVLISIVGNLWDKIWENIDSHGCNKCRRTFSKGIRYWRCLQCRRNRIWFELDDSCYEEGAAEHSTQYPDHRFTEERA